MRSTEFRGFISRFLCVNQTIRAFMNRIPCVRQTSVRPCSLFCAFNRLSCVYVQNFMPSPDYQSVHDLTFVLSSDYSCLHDQTFVLSPDFRAFMNRIPCVRQTSVRPCSFFCAFNRLSCIHVQTFAHSTDFRAFMSRISCPHQTIGAFTI